MISLFSTVLEISLGTSVAIALALLLHRVLEARYAARWRCLLWLVLAVRLLLPVNPTLTEPPVQLEWTQAVAAPVRQEQVPAAKEQEIALPGAETDSAGISLPEGTHAASSRSMNLPQAAALLWMAGMGVFLLWQAGGYLTFCKQIRRCRSTLKKEEIYHLLAEESRALKLRRPVSVCLCSGISSPMMAGFRRPSILLPREDYRPQELRLILRHELVHYRRRDIWYKLLLVAANAVHWFNPLVWMMVRRADCDIESACDEAVVCGGDLMLRRQYGEAILHCASRQKGAAGPACSTGFACGAREMKQRLAGILDTREKRRGLIAVAILLLAALTAAVCIAVGTPKQPLLTQNRFEAAGRLVTLQQLPQDPFQDTVARWFVSRGTGDWAEIDRLCMPDFYTGALEQQQFEEGHYALSYRLGRMVTDPDEATAGELIAQEAEMLRRDGAALGGRFEGHVVYLEFEQKLTESSQGMLYADGRYGSCYLVGRSSRRGDYRIYRAGMLYGLGEMPDDPLPQGDLPDYLDSAMEQKQRTKLVDQYDCLLTRLDCGYTIPVAPAGTESLMELLVSLQLRPAEDRQNNLSMVEKPVELQLENRESGALDRYIITAEGVQYNGVLYHAQRPGALTDWQEQQRQQTSGLGAFTMGELFRLGDLLRLETERVEGVVYTTLPIGDTVTLEGTQAAQAAAGLLEWLVVPVKQGNPGTGGLNRFDLLLDDGTMYTLTDDGFFVTLSSGEERYQSVFTPVPEAFFTEKTEDKTVR